MIPFIIPCAQICQLDQRGDASQKDSIVGATRANIVLFALIGEQRHFKILYGLCPIVAPIHIVLLAFDQQGVNTRRVGATAPKCASCIFAINMINWAEIRKQFPVTEGVAYLNSAAAGPVSRASCTAASDYY